MRVAYVYAGNAPVFGRRGASVHMQEVVRALRRRGAEVELVARRFGRDRLPGLEAIPIHPLDHDPERDANARVVETLERLPPTDIVYERFSLGSYAGMEHARASGAAGVLEINGPRVEKAAARGALGDRPAAEDAASRAVAAASAVVAVSEAVAGYVRDKYGVEDRLHVIPNGVDPDRFPGSVIDARATKAGPFTVGFVGTFKGHHGLDTLVEAFSLFAGRHPGARLLLVGDGPEREAVEESLEARGLAGSAVLAGAVAPTEVAGLLAQMDVAVAPYPTRRNYVSPLKVFEYMAAGLPVVGSGAKQVADLVSDGKTGILVAPEDPAALAAALSRLAAHPELRGRLGQEARTRVLEHHTWDSVASRILALSGPQATVLT